MKYCLRCMREITAEQSYVCDKNGLAHVNIRCLCSNPITVDDLILMIAGKYKEEIEVQPTRCCPVETCSSCCYLEERNDKNDYTTYYCSDMDCYLSGYPVIPKDCKLPKWEEK